MISTQVKSGGEVRNNPPACAPSTSLSPVLVGEWGICRVEITGKLLRVYAHVYVYVYIYKHIHICIYIKLTRCNYVYLLLSAASSSREASIRIAFTVAAHACNGGRMGG